MHIFHIEVYGLKNTADYVDTITSSLSLSNDDKIFIITSRKNKYKNKNLLTFFSGYNLSRNYIIKIIYYFIGWIKTFGYLVRDRQKNKILHLHWLKFSPSDYFFIKLLHRKGIKICYTVHNLLPHEPKPYDNYFFPKLYKVIDYLIFHYEITQKDFVKKFQFLPKNYTIIPHFGYQVQKFVDINDIESNTILFIGLIRKYKGLDILLESLKYLDDKLELNVTIAGKPDMDLSGVFRLSEEINNIEITWITEWLSEEKMENLFHSNFIVVLPYKDIDTSGMIHLAMSYGKIVIATNIGGIKDIINNNVTGLLFEKNNIKQLSELICEVVMNKKKYQKIGDNAAKEMDNKHSVCNIGKDLTGLYRKIIKEV